MLRQVEVEQERGISETPRRESDTEATRIRQTVARRTVVAGVGDKREKIIVPIAGFTVALLALHTASGMAKEAAIHLSLTDYRRRNISFEEASSQADVCMQSLWVAQMLLSTIAASYLSPRVARWSIALSNLLYFLAMTTEYSLTVSPIWVLSRSQLTGWGYAILCAVTISIAQIMAAEQLARWRTRRKSRPTLTPAPSIR
ncbi:MAG: hypothetical protein H7145_24970 [Akkermansiaceae bacterium]|nr:hypothetical protein [Armatimonadota bacterium]